jgi:hypothetical protein
MVGRSCVQRGAVKGGSSRGIAVSGQQVALVQQQLQIVWCGADGLFQRGQCRLDFAQRVLGLGQAKPGLGPPWPLLVSCR